MAGANRDVTLGVGIKTTGEQALRSLAGEVQNLAKAGGDAAPTYQALADELLRLSRQAGALDEFKQLAADVASLSESQTKAAETAKGFEASLREQQGVSKQLADAQDAARLAVREAASELAKAKLAVEQLNVETSKADKQTDSYQAQLRSLKAAVVEAKGALLEKRDALAKAKDAASEAAAAEKDLQSKFDATNASATKAAAALREREAAMREASTTAEAYGLSVRDVAEAEQQILATQQKLAEDVALQRQTEEAKKWAAATAEAVAKVDALAAEATKLNQANQYAKWWADELARVESQARAAAEAVRMLEAENAAAAAAAEAQKRAADEFERMAASAAKANQAAEYTRWWAEQLTRVDAEARAAAQSAQGLADAQALVTAELDKQNASAAKARDLQEQAAAKTQKLADEAARMVKAAEYTQWWAQQLDKLDAEARASAESMTRLMQASESAGRMLTEAFGTVGLRSLATIDMEVEQVERAMSLLERQFRAGAISAADFDRALSSANVRLAQLRQEAATIPALPGQFEKLSSSISSVISRFAGLGAAIATVAVAVRPVVDATVQLDQMRRVLTSVTGSAEAAAKQIEYVRQVADRSGLSFASVSESYAKFAAAASASGLEMATVQKVFESVSLAAGNLGLNVDEVQGSLLALSQMASKGTVSMEELRGQLGDRLPGALSLMAKGLGLTEQQLNKLVESGQLLSKDALPALANALVELGPKGEKGVEGIVASYNRLKSTVTETVTIISDGAVGKAVGATLSGVGWALEKLSYATAAFAESWTVAGKIIGTVAGAVVSRDFKGLQGAIEQITKESADKLEGLASRTHGVGQAATQAAPEVKTLADQVRAATDSIVKGNPALEAQAKALKDTSDAGQQTAKTWVQIQANAAQALTIAEKEAVTSDKVAKAKKIEGDARAAVIALAGNERTSVAASLESSRQYTMALDAQAAADDRVAKILRDQVEALKAKAAETGRNDEATKKAIQTLEASAQSREADAKRTREQADAAWAHTQQLELQANALKDTGAQVDLYRKNVDDARKALEDVRTQMVMGLATQEDEKRALIELSLAQGQYKNALDDSVAAIERNAKAKEADKELALAGLQVQLEQAKADAATWQRLGDEWQSRQALIRVKEIELQIDKAKLEISKLEAQASLETARAKLAELQATDPLNTVKQKELEIEVKLAEAKLKLTDATGEALRARQAEIDAIKAGIVNMEGDTNTRQTNSSAVLSQAGAVGQYTSALEQQIDTEERALKLKERQIALDNKRRNVDANGFSLDMTGKQTINAAGNTFLSIVNYLKSAGLSDAQAQDVARQFTDAQGNVPYMNNPGQAKYGASTLTEALSKAAQQTLFGADGSGASQGSKKPTDSSPSSSGTKTIVLKLGSKNYTLSGLSDANASTIESLFSQLEAEAARAA